MPDKKTLVTAARGLTYASVWDIAKEQEKSKLFPNQKRSQSADDRLDVVLSLDLSADGKTLVMGGLDQPASLWNASDWTFEVELRGSNANAAGAEYVCMLPAGAIVFCKGESPGTFIDIGSKQVVLELKDDNQYGREIAVSPDGSLVATARFRDVCIWSSKSGKLLWSLNGDYWSVAFAPDSRFLAVGNGSGSVTVYKIWKGEKD